MCFLVFHGNSVEAQRIVSLHSRLILFTLFLFVVKPDELLVADIIKAHLFEYLREFLVYEQLSLLGENV